MDLVVGISKGCLAQQNSEVAMAREGNQQREQHVQILPPEQPFNSAATTNGEAELEDTGPNIGKEQFL